MRRDIAESTGVARYDGFVVNEVIAEGLAGGNTGTGWGRAREAIPPDGEIYLLLNLYPLSIFNKV